MAKQTVWVLGNHAVKALLSINPERGLELWASISPNNQAQAELINLATQHGIPIHPVDKRELSRITGSDQTQGVALRARPKADLNERDLESFIRQVASKSVPLLLILDQVQDPHNFGACLRTADAAGVHAVIVAKDNASPMTPVVQKVASGAAETMPIFRVTNLARSMELLKQTGVWLIGTSDRAQSTLYQADLTGPLAIVMGAEGKGMRQLTTKNCDSLLRLPMAGTVVSSLNVSVATGVCLYEVVRQRGQG